MPDSLPSREYQLSVAFFQHIHMNIIGPEAQLTNVYSQEVSGILMTPAILQCI